MKMVKKGVNYHQLEVLSSTFISEETSLLGNLFLLCEPEKELENKSRGFLFHNNIFHKIEKEIKVYSFIAYVVIFDLSYPQ